MFYFRNAQYTQAGTGQIAKYSILISKLKKPGGKVCGRPLPWEAVRDELHSGYL